VHAHAVHAVARLVRLVVQVAHALEHLRALGRAGRLVFEPPRVVLYGLQLGARQGPDGGQRAHLERAGRRVAAQAARLLGVPLLLRRRLDVGPLARLVTLHLLGQLPEQRRVHLGRLGDRAARRRDFCHEAREGLEARQQVLHLGLLGRGREERQPVAVGRRERYRVLSRAQRPAHQRQVVLGRERLGEQRARRLLALVALGAHRGQQVAAALETV
jgi:hypothetical protein